MKPIFWISAQVLTQMTRICFSQGLLVQKAPLAVRSPLLCDRLVLCCSHKSNHGILQCYLNYRQMHSNYSIMCALHSSPHAVSPVPKPACLKIIWVPLCYRYFPAPEDFDQSNSSTRSSSLDDFRDGQALSFRVISHLFVDIESKCLSYKNVRDVMKELVQMQSCFTSQREGRTSSGKQQL